MSPRLKLLTTLSLFWFLMPLFLTGKDKHAPLPAQLMSAKTMYVENHADAKLADKAYDELVKWGRFKVVTAKEDADVVLILSDKVPQHTSGTTSSYDYKTGTWQQGSVNANTAGYTYISVTDNKSGETLFSDEKAWGYKSATRKIIDDLRKRIEEQEKE